MDLEVFLNLSFVFGKSDQPLLEVITNHFSRRTNKRPEILADLITGSTNPGTFNQILRKAVFRCFWTLRSFEN